MPIGLGIFSSISCASRARGQIMFETCSLTWSTFRVLARQHGHRQRSCCDISFTFAWCTSIASCSERTCSVNPSISTHVSPVKLPDASHLYTVHLLLVLWLLYIHRNSQRRRQLFRPQSAPPTPHFRILGRSLRSSSCSRQRL